MIDELATLARTLHDVITKASLDEDTPASDLRRVLVFVSEVARVVDHAFSNVLVVLTTYVTLEERDLVEQRLPALAQELQLLQTRSFYRNAGDICGQLRMLRENYETSIAPVIAHLPGQERWGRLFWLLEDREGQIVQMVGRAVSELAAELYDYTGYPGFSAVSTGMWYSHVSAGSASVESIRRRAAETGHQIIALLCEIQEIKNSILGLSGRPGLLELVNTDRYKLRTAVTQIVHEGDIFMESKYHISGGSVGAVGDHAEAHHNVIASSGGSQPLDLTTLSLELRRLAEAARAEAIEPDHKLAVGALEAAEAAAANGDEAGMLRYLKSGGTWVADVATKIGTTVIAEILKRQMGL